MYAIGLIWGPWDIGHTETYFKHAVTPQEYTTAVRAYLGSPKVTAYPIIRALGKVHRAELNFSISNVKQTSLYAVLFDAVSAHIPGKVQLTNWALSDTPVSCEVPHEQYEVNLSIWAASQHIYKGTLREHLVSATQPGAAHQLRKNP